MAFVVTVRNTETEVTAEVTVNQLQDLGGNQITDVRLTAGSRGIQAADLLMLEHLGLSLPQRDPDPVAAPTKTVRKAPVKAAKKAGPRAVTATASPGGAAGSPAPPVKAAKKAAGSKPAKKPDRGPRVYRQAPAAEVLAEVLARHTFIGDAAVELEVPRHTLSGWIRRYRNMGHAMALVTPDGQQQLLPVAGGGSGK